MNVLLVDDHPLILSALTALIESLTDYPKMVPGLLYPGLGTFLAMTLLAGVRRRTLFWLK